MGAEKGGGGNRGSLKRLWRGWETGPPAHKRMARSPVDCRECGFPAWARGSDARRCRGQPHVRGEGRPLVLSDRSSGRQAGTRDRGMGTSVKVWLLLPGQEDTGGQEEKRGLEASMT